MQNNCDNSDFLQKVNLTLRLELIKKLKNNVQGNNKKNTSDIQKICNNLILEYLHQQDYQFTLEIFQNEAEFFQQVKIDEQLKMQTKQMWLNKFQISFENLQFDKNQSIIQNLLQKCIKQIQKKEQKTQTIQIDIEKESINLEEKLKLIKENFQIMQLRDNFEKTYKEINQRNLQTYEKKIKNFIENEKQKLQNEIKQNYEKQYQEIRNSFDQQMQERYNQLREKERQIKNDYQQKKKNLETMLALKENQIENKYNKMNQEIQLKELQLSNLQQQLQEKENQNFNQEQNLDIKSKNLQDKEIRISNIIKIEVEKIKHQTLNNIIEKEKAISNKLQFIENSVQEIQNLKQKTQNETENQRQIIQIKVLSQKLHLSKLREKELENDVVQLQRIQSEKNNLIIEAQQKEQKLQELKSQLSQQQLQINDYQQKYQQSEMKKISDFNMYQIKIKQLKEIILNLQQLFFEYQSVNQNDKECQVIQNFDKQEQSKQKLNNNNNIRTHINLNHLNFKSSIKQNEDEQSRERILKSQKMDQKTQQDMQSQTKIQNSNIENSDSIKTESLLDFFQLRQLCIPKNFQSKKVVFVI